MVPQLVYTGLAAQSARRQPKNGPSFRGDAPASNYDVQLHIREGRDD
jgi:hypothetical protein